MKILYKSNVVSITRITIMVIVMLWICAVTLTSCKKIIDIQPPISSLEQDVVFNSNDQAIAAITGIYASMSTSLNYASGGTGSVTLYTGVSSDEMIGYGPLLPYYENQLTSELSNLASIYSQPYNSIYVANSILEGLAKSNKVSDTLKAQLKGEAHFVRAFAYFYLTNIFGEVPIQLTTDYRITSVAYQSTVPQVYQQIISDLTIAEGLLSEAYPTAGRVRPNKSVVQAMLARTYLYLKDWQNAEKYASLVIAKNSIYSLVNYDAVFLANSQETIWQLMQAVNTFSPDGNLFIPVSNATIPSTVSLSKEFATTAFEAGDKRQIAWVKNYTVGATTYYYPYKYKARAATTATEYSMVFRLAEQYLIRSEARINSGQVALGIGDLNFIRQRPLPIGSNANIIPALPTTLVKSDALVAVEKERRVELFSEWGHRWFDLKRTGRIEAVLGVLKSNWQSTDSLYPIPFNEISRNQNIKQNDGY